MEIGAKVKVPVCLVHMPANSSNLTDHSLQLLSTSTHLAFMLVYSLSCSSIILFYLIVFDNIVILKSENL